MKLQEAKDTTVFEIENGEVKEVNLYEKMQRSIDETTSPRGVEPRYFMEEVFEFDEDTGEDTDVIAGYYIYKWYFGRKKSVCDELLTEEEAEEKLFEFLEVDFENDWDNSCNMFFTFEEAEQIEAERMSVDLEVYRSIKRKEVAVKELRKKKAQEEREAINFSRHNLAITYANTIPLIHGETKQETQTRISKQLGRIEKDVFWRVVQIVRSKQNN